MIIGICQASLYFPQSSSLKDKRNILRSIKLRLRNHYNVSVSELDDYNLWQSTLLGIVCVGKDKKYVNKVLNEVISFLERKNESELVNYEINII